MLSKRVFGIKRRRVHPEELEKTPIKRAPRGGSKYYRLSASTEGSECEAPAPEPAREDAEQRIGGSQ